jgi:hypothetical protein
MGVLLNNGKGMSIHKIAAPLLIFIFLLMPILLDAQEVVLSESEDARTQIALIPFRGSDQRMIDGFGAELAFAINNREDYRPIPIDMTNLPPDVPEGGFPPYICPSPSLTKGIPYAVTGELTEDPDTGAWHMRLYLWRMEDNRLLFSDELVSNTPEEARGFLPGFVDWMLSWLEELVPPEPQIVEVPVSGSDGDVGRIRYFFPEFMGSWLYVGVRAGGALWINALPRWDNPSSNLVGNN